MPIATADEAVGVATEYAAKRFGFQDFRTLTTIFDGNYFTVTLWRRDEEGSREHGIEPQENAGEESVAATQASGTNAKAPRSGPSLGKKFNELLSVDEQLKPHYREVHGLFFCDVKVDKNGLVVGFARTIRTADEAEEIAKEYARDRYGLTHFIPYTTTFDGNYFLVYAGGIAIGKGVTETVRKIHTSNFYDVKVDKTGLVVGWTTEGKIAHFTAKLQRIR